MNKRKKILITCALPYVNGYCHIGHLRTYIPGDFLNRWLKKLGYKTSFICGSDTHGTPILFQAEKEGVRPEKIVEKYHNHFENVFRKISIKFDKYGSTDSPTNHLLTREIVKRLSEKGYIYSKKIMLPYCPKCNRFLPDRYIVGTCPYCGFEEARGDECEKCGKHLEPGEIKDAKCKICGHPAELREDEHYFFKLSAFTDFLMEYLKQLRGTENAINYARRWVSEGLRDWCITRRIEWGVKFPGREDLVLYVWVDAPIGYISITKEMCDERGENWREYWKDKAQIIHFIGEEITYHHCIFWPAMLKGAGYNLPYAVIASGMITLNNSKLSKTRGNVIWVEQDYLANGLHPDLLRYYILSYTSHTKSLDFSWKAFMNKVNSELVGNFGNFAYRTLSLTYRNYGEIPVADIELEVKERIQLLVSKIEDFLFNYEFKKLIDEIMALSSWGNGYLQKKEPWKQVRRAPEEAKRTLRTCLQILKAMSILMEPVMPIKMEELWRQLGQDGTVEKAPIDEAVREIEEGRKIPKPKPLFKPLTEEEVRKLEEVLKSRVDKSGPGGT